MSRVGASSIVQASSSFGRFPARASAGPVSQTVAVSRRRMQPPRPSWGNMIADGTQLLESAPVLTIVPGVAITLTVLCLNVLSDALRDALDPRSRRRAA